MKTPILLISLTVAAGLASIVYGQNDLIVPPSAPFEAVSEKAAAVGLLPHQKQGKVLEPKERNPFAEQVRVEAAGEVKDANSEESKIRAVLMTMKVTGVTRAGDGRLKGMLGRFVLEEDRELSQIIPNQTDILKVTKVTDEQVEITWVDVEGSEQPRKHVIELDMEAKVGVMLPSPGGETDGQLLSPIDPRAAEKREQKRHELTLRNDPLSPAE